jgi:hypothetical protein
MCIWFSHSLSILSSINKWILYFVFCTSNINESEVCEPEDSSEKTFKKKNQNDKSTKGQPKKNLIGLTLEDAEFLSLTQRLSERVRSPRKPLKSFKCDFCPSFFLDWTTKKTHELTRHALEFSRKKYGWCEQSQSIQGWKISPLAARIGTGFRPGRRSVIQFMGFSKPTVTSATANNQLIQNSHQTAARTSSPETIISKEKNREMRGLKLWKRVKCQITFSSRQVAGRLGNGMNDLKAFPCASRLTSEFTARIASSREIPRRVQERRQ